MKKKGKKQVFGKMNRRMMKRIWKSKVENSGFYQE